MATRQRITQFDIPNQRLLSRFASLLGDMLDEIPHASTEGYMVGSTRLSRDGTVTWGHGVAGGLIDVTIWQAKRDLTPVW